MKTKLKIQFSYGPWFSPKVTRGRMNKNPSHATGSYPAQPNTKPVPQVLVILPNGKVVRRPHPFPRSAALAPLA